MLTFIKHILRRYFKLSIENPLIILDLLYSKTRSDCRRIQFGDEGIKSEVIFFNLMSFRPKIWMLRSMKSKNLAITIKADL